MPAICSVAESGRTVVEAGIGWAPCRVTFQNGRDEAHHALLEVLLTENVVGSFGSVVIGSGDHIFALARYLRAHGVHVTVVAANRRSLSNVLRREADSVILLDLTTPGVGNAA